MSDPARLREITAKEGRVILALDGLQPDVGKELKKHVRGIRVLERQVEGRSDPEAEVVRGYCAAVRSALTDDGRPPLEASGLKLHARLTAIEQSLSRAEKGGSSRAPSCDCAGWWARWRATRRRRGHWRRRSGTS